MADPTAAWLAEQEQARKISRLQAGGAHPGPPLNTARQHLTSAETLQEADPLMSLTASYDAARKAVTAHMNAAGYRPESGDGSHKLMVDYTRIALPAVDAEALDRLRRARHNAEYGNLAAERIDPPPATAIEQSRAIVNTVAADLANRPTTQRRPPTRPR